MKRVLIAIAVLAMLTPAALWAQDGLTLEGLAERVNAIAARVDAIETAIAPTHTPVATHTPVSTATPFQSTVTPTTTPTAVPAATFPRYELEDIFAEYKANEARAAVKYEDKVIEVAGDILDIEKKGGGFFSGKERYEITLEGSGFLSYLDCSLPLSSEEEVLQLNAGEPVILRGEITFGSGTIINMKDCEIVKK